MVKTQNMVLKEQIASGMQRLKLKYFGDHSLEMAIPDPVSPTYQGLSGEEAVEAEEDFYYKWKKLVICKYLEFGTDRITVRCIPEIDGLKNLLSVNRRSGKDMEIGRKNMLKNEGSCNDGNVVLSKRYKASDMQSVKDASVLEMRTVHARSNKCQPHEREMINSSSSSPNKHSTTKNLESTQRERRKIMGFDKVLSEGDKRLKRAKDYGSRRWQYSSVVWGKLDSTANSHTDTEEFVLKMGSSSVNKVSTSGRMNESNNEGEGRLEQFPGFPGQLVSYPPGFDAFREFCKAKAALGEKWSNCVEFSGQTWNDNVIWVKGNCLQRDDEEPLDLRFRIVKQSVKSTVERKKSLLDEIAKEETELKLLLEGLSLSRKKKVDSKSDKIRKAQSTRSMAGIDEDKKQISGEEVRTKTPWSGSSAQPNLPTSKIAQKFPKKWMLKSLPALGATESGEVAKEKRRRVKYSGEKVAEVRPVAVDDLREVEERARLATLHGDEDTSKMVAHLLKGIRLGIEEEKIELKKMKSGLEKNLAWAKTEAMMEVREKKASHIVAIGQLQEVDAIQADTYVEEGEDEEAEVVGIVNGLDGVSRQTVLDNQGDDVELPEGGSEKVVRETSLRINYLDSGLARERETSKALLSAQAELQVELDSPHVREDHVLMCNREFAEQFDRMKEANKNREDKYLKAHFKLEKLNQAIFDLTLQVEEIDYEIKKGLEELSEVAKCVEKLQRQVKVLVVKGNQANMTQYRIQTLE
ncbi:hypothetical protein GIB67_015722 [Kingdonia uniflora]|uniref:Uncharacterized protein n=1 Tax=Kingdonia uniflora TaxID=39325 RepID=A0A7J7NUN8_9MAGN|nr:hypothetical protein GIB67_015722 [Kingdonia uniflora]